MWIRIGFYLNADPDPDPGSLAPDTGQTFKSQKMSFERQETRFNVNLDQF